MVRGGFSFGARQPKHDTLEERKSASVVPAPAVYGARPGGGRLLRAVSAMNSPRRWPPVLFLPTYGVLIVGVEDDNTTLSDSIDGGGCNTTLACRIFRIDDVEICAVLLGGTKFT